MTDQIAPTQADRDFARNWNYECKRCSEYEGDFEADLAEAVAAHRTAAERTASAEPVAWMYIHTSGRVSLHNSRWGERDGHVFCDHDEWAETPLYRAPPSADVAELVDALKGFDDDYMTSEKHHPRYVLIPTWRFENIRAVLAKHGAELVGRKYRMGDRVAKIKGSSWTGLVVGFYSTSLTPIGYAVESENEPGSVQIYPESALAKHGGAA